MQICIDSWLLSAVEKPKTGAISIVLRRYYMELGPDRVKRTGCWALTPICTLPSHQSFALPYRRLRLHRPSKAYDHIIAVYLTSQKSET